MKTAAHFGREKSSGRNSRRGRIGVLVGMAAGLSFLVGLAAAFDFIELTSAIHTGSGLAAAGGITAFLGES